MQIKILQFPIGNTKGGITQYALSNWKFIDREKFHFDFATMSPKLSFEKELQHTGSKIFYIRRYAEDDKSEFEKAFREILVHEKYDIIHLHTSYWKSLSAEKIAKEEGVPGVIIHAHASDIADANRNIRGEEQEQFQARHNEILNQVNTDVATDFWACSRVAGKFLFGDRIPASRIQIMNNAIDVNKFKYDFNKREFIREEFQLKNSFVMGYVGRFQYPKNQMFLLRLMKKIVKEYNSVKLVLVGQGEDFLTCKKFVEANGLDGYVIFTGFQSSVEDWLQSFDILVFPSENEGFPVALVEAQASGLFCVISDRVTRDIKITNRVEFLPLDEDIWQNEINRFINSKNFQSHVAIEDEMLSKYDIHTQIKNLEDRYMEIVQRKL